MSSRLAVVGLMSATEKRSSSGLAAAEEEPGSQLRGAAELPPPGERMRTCSGLSCRKKGPKVPEISCSGCCCSKRGRMSSNSSSACNQERGE
jgi:hypothetical protein